MDFSSFKLHPRIAAGVKALGYETPTPIQIRAIPPVLAGKDVMGLAQTGTGKTAAFVLPILERLLPGPRGRVRSLVITPTRELAEQIHVSIGELGRNTHIRSSAIYGGVPLNAQIQKLRAGVDIVVACPGRLLDLLNQKTIDLGSLEVLVIDEADRMFDMGFLPDVRRIVGQLPSQRQTLMFSATMPDDIRKLTDEVLRDPVTVKIGHAAPATTVSHALYPVAQHLKTALLMELLKQTDAESILIFTRTKHRARRIGQQLEKAGYKAASLQGNLSQNRRQHALDGFRNGSFQILVATDIAARGLDVLSISHVINYDIPDTTDAYTHRIGRTGRAAKTGDAFTFITPADEPLIRDIEHILGGKIERRLLKDFDYTKSAPVRDAEFDELSQVEECGIVRDPGGLGDIVRHLDDGHRVFQLGNQFFDVRRRFGIESGRRLVEKKDLGAHGQGPGDAEALLLSAGKKGPLAVQRILHFPPQPRPAQRFFDDLIHLAPAHLDPVQVVPGDHVVIDTHGGKRIRPLKDHPHLAPHDDRIGLINIMPLEQDLPGHPGVGRKFMHPVDAADEGGLAASGGADDRRQGVPGERQVYILEDRIFAEGGAEFLDL